MKQNPKRSYSEAAAELEHAKEEYARGEALTNVPYRQTLIRVLCLAAMPVLYFGVRAILRHFLGDLSKFVTIIFTAFSILVPLAVYSAFRSSHMNMVGAGLAIMKRSKADIERLEKELAELSASAIGEEKKE